MISHRAALATIVFGAFGCAPSSPPAVTVTGDAANRASLAGKWTGDYRSAATGRSGSIVFNLSPSGDAAHGDVVMIPAGHNQALQRFETGPAMSQLSPSQVLTIRLVQVGDGTVSGVLDAYRDPSCNCPVETTFTGRLRGDTIEGTFTTRGSQTSQTGNWRVKRSN